MYRRCAPIVLLTMCPAVVAQAPDPGELLVGGFFNNGVLRYSDAGAFTGVFAGPGSGQAGIHHMEFGPDGHLYVASFNNSRVVRFNGVTGAFIDLFVWNDPGQPGDETGGLNAASAVAFTDDGAHLLVASHNTDRVHRYDAASGAFIDLLVWDDPGMAGDETGGLQDPEGIAVRGTHLYVASAGNNRIIRYNASTGAFIDLFVWDDPATPEDENAGLSDPHNIAFGPDGDLYAASFGSSRATRFDGVTGLPVIEYLGGLSLAHGVRVGPDGSVYVASFNNDRVVRFDRTTGGSLGTFVSTGSGGLNGPATLLFYPCRADFNDDGLINTADFLAFLNAFNASHPRTDINGDGLINTADFLAFLNLYNAGC